MSGKPTEKTVLKFGCVVGLALTATTVAAKPLSTVWTLDPMGPVGAMDVKFGEPFLEQRLLPFKLARLTSAAVFADGKSLPVGTYLFVVYQDDGKTAYCTSKDQSSGHVAKSLFIPMLDKRPCLVDADKDGMFEANFGVFDKYGSALTPSGNLSSAKPLKVRARYELTKPEEFPVVRKLSYALSKVKPGDTQHLIVQFDNGRGYQGMINRSEGDSPAAASALNLRTEVKSVSGNYASIVVMTEPSIYIIGDSGGSFGAGLLPSYTAASK